MPVSQSSAPRDSASVEGPSMGFCLEDEVGRKTQGRRRAARAKSSNCGDCATVGCATRSRLRKIRNGADIRAKSLVGKASVRERGLTPVVQKISTGYPSSVMARHCGPPRWRFPESCEFQLGGPDLPGRDGQVGKKDCRRRPSSISIRRDLSKHSHTARRSRHSRFCACRSRHPLRRRIHPRDSRS